MRWRGRAALLGAIGLSFALSGPAAAGEPRLEVVTGSVELASGEPPVWRQAQVGDVLLPGDRLRTGADGRAELRLPSGSVRVYEDSVLRLPRPEEARDGDFVELDRGSSLFDILKRPDRSFEVRTPEGIAMVKGTRFSVAVEADGSAVGVFRGLVAVTGLRDDGLREVLVRPGWAALGGAGQPFELQLLDAGSDPWESWSSGAELPVPLSPPPARAALDGSRTDAKALAEAAIAAQTSDLIEALHEAEADSDRSSESVPAAAAEEELELESDDLKDDSEDLAVKLDPVSDVADSAEIKESVAETALGDGTRSFSVELINGSGTSGGDYALITGTGFEEKLDESTLKDVVEGDTSLFSPELLDALDDQGVEPEAFAGTLLDGLD
jgi:hypothetical protein